MSDFFVAFSGAMVGAVAQGVLWGIMALGVYITFKINGGLEYNAYSFGLKTCEEGLKVAFCDYVTDNRLYGKAYVADVTIK